MRLSLQSIGCLCFITLVFVALAGATLLEHRTPQQLGAQAEIVVRGRVESSLSYWNDKHTKIYTRTHIAVDETYKGAVSAGVDIIQIGGIVGNVKITAHGAAHWRVGDEVLLFAEPHDVETYHVSGFSQGKFAVERDPETGEPFILAPRQEGARLLGAPPGGQVRTSASGVPLDDFVSRALGRSVGEGVGR